MYQGTATSAYTQPASLGQTTLKPPGPRVMQSVERLEKAVQVMADFAARMASLADRVCGSVPQAVEKEPEPLNPSSSVGMIEAHIETLLMLQRRTETQLQRLETL